MGLLEEVCPDQVGGLCTSHEAPHEYQRVLYVDLYLCKMACPSNSRTEDEEEKDRKRFRKKAMKHKRRLRLLQSAQE